MGILNVTPDSFSDGGCYLDVEQAVAHAELMVAEGASLIDIGGESSRPEASPVSISEELARILPVIRAIVDTVDVLLSVDTYKAEVARHALEAGAHLINDITALRGDTTMAAVVSEMEAGLILMHMKGMRWQDVEIRSNTVGKPELVLHGEVQRCAQERNINSTFVSMSHTNDYAVAQVTLCSV
ncbi:Dihydropteroate synthase [Geodia barretti]|uniref:dihydropteroate synthase n=1 Tax=Geodia barretti TaxID=519541 RepID=A0AA35WIC7_GEOBA|nr:Dihydropteroate synthase [Geodia barretti]